MKKVAMRFASVTYSKFGNEAIATQVKKKKMIRSMIFSRSYHLIPKDWFNSEDT